MAAESPTSASNESTPDPQPNLLWGRAVARALVLGGVRHVIISPGSRSTPLVFACAREPGLECLPIVDERSAAFFALGLARRGNDPVALICTSGSAAAHYLPAIIEASESGIPLLVLTADRPPEARDCASGQTIDQLKLYGSYVRHFSEVALPESGTAALRYLRQVMAHSIRTTRGPTPGPVHLNFPFRDPLVPEAGKGNAPPSLPEDWDIDNAFPEKPAQAAASLEGIDPAWFAKSRGIIVVGPRCREVDSSEFSQGILAFASLTGWPILADAANRLRSEAADANAVIAHYDAILRAPSAVRQLMPERVIQVGALPTSKVLRGWLAGAPASCRFIVVDDFGKNLDPLHRHEWSTTASAQALADALGNTGYVPDASPTFRRRWLAADQAAAQSLAAAINSHNESAEPAWPAILRSTLPANARALYASSMPVRDAEFFLPAAHTTPIGISSRGANGIDGTLSTALGAAHAADYPVVLVTGDLAFLHDSNGLLAHRICRGKLVVLLINNHGGGIFAHLPIRQWDPPFTEFFATPQEIDFAGLCAAHGVTHTQTSDTPSLREALVKAFAKSPTGIRVIEFTCEREHSVATRQRWLAEAAAAAEASFASTYPLQ